MSEVSLSIASWRLRSWLRKRLEVMISTPSRVNRRPDSPIRRLRTSAGKEAERRTSKRRRTEVSTLLTFWPPGPGERVKLSSISFSSMVSSGVIAIFISSSA